jgi:NNP family nitrate/nitrite transporter-like MFS transporter
MLGALGGFFLPPAFGMLARMAGNPQAAFLVLFGLTLCSLGWLHLTVIRMSAASRAVNPQPGMVQGSISAEVV